jgi:PEP-CTERM motif
VDPSVAGGVETAGANSGNGSVTINFLGSAVPEPGTWTLIIASFGIFGAALRRRLTCA